MVKLFVGNLAEGVDSHRLKNLFLQYVHVQECDVLKNFAFVHVVTEEDAETIISKLDKYRLDGREIHIERSTSRLRKEPGMSDKCFTCGAFDHKTPFCPKEAHKRKDTASSTNAGTSSSTVSTSAGQQRSDDSSSNGGSAAKKARFLSSYLEDSTSKLPPEVVVKMVGNNDNADPELPCPQNSELRTLYDQYIESRTRYFFYRDRLQRELKVLIESGTFIADTSPVEKSPIHLGTFDLTKLSTGGGTSTAPTAVASSSSVPISTLTSTAQSVHQHTPYPLSSAVVSATPQLHNAISMTVSVQPSAQPTQALISGVSMTPAIQQSFSTGYTSSASGQQQQVQTQSHYNVAQQFQPPAQPQQLTHVVGPQSQQSQQPNPAVYGAPTMMSTQQPVLIYGQPQPAQQAQPLYQQQQQIVQQSGIQHPGKQQQQNMPLQNISHVMPNPTNETLSQAVQSQHSYSGFGASTTLTTSSSPLSISRVNLSAALNNNNNSNRQEQPAQLTFRMKIEPGGDGTGCGNQRRDNSSSNRSAGNQTRSVINPCGNLSNQQQQRHQNNNRQHNNSRGGNRQLISGQSTSNSSRRRTPPGSAQRGGNNTTGNNNNNAFAALVDPAVTNPLLANLAAATVAALRAAPRLVGAPMPLAHARPLLPHPRGPSPSSGGGSAPGSGGERFPPLMGRPRP